MNALQELAWTVWDIFQTGDPLGHLVAWWEVVTGAVTPDSPAGDLTPMGEVALQEQETTEGAHDATLAEV